MTAFLTFLPIRTAAIKASIHSTEATVLRIISKPDIDRLAFDTSMDRARGLPGQLVGRVACPLCHTAISSASSRYAWQCRRCGQHWTALRLETVASYAAWTAARARSRGAGPVDQTAVEL